MVLIVQPQTEKWLLDFSKFVALLLFFFLPIMLEFKPFQEVFSLIALSSFHKPSIPPPPPVMFKMEEKQVWTRIRIQHDASVNLSICIDSFPQAVLHISLHAFVSPACCYF